jgi:cytochrome b subunit of formate dehydrogenase
MGFIMLLRFGYYGAGVIVDKIRGYSVREKWFLLQIFSLVFVKYMLHRSIWLINPKHPLPEWVHKYDSEELFEYWGEFAGSIIISVTGVLMAFWSPSVDADLAFIFHTREAILAVMFLLLVHMAYTHLSPIIFPYNEVFHSGKSSLTWLRSTQGGTSN